MTKARAQTKQKKLKNSEVVALPAPEYVFDPEVIKAGQDEDVCKSIQVIDSSKKNAARTRKKKNTDESTSSSVNKSKKNHTLKSDTSKKSSNSTVLEKKLPDKLANEIQGIILIAISLMLLTGLTINSDSLLCTFSNILTRLAGYGAYLFSLLFWLWGFESFRGRTFFRGYMDHLAWSISFLTVIFLSQSISLSGGSIGETLWPIVNKITGPAGATVFLSALSIISFLLVAEILFSDFIVNTGRLIVWTSIRGRLFMQWFLKKSKKGFQFVKASTIKLFGILRSLYKETFGAASRVAEPHNDCNEAETKLNSVCSSFNQQTDNNESEQTISDTDTFETLTPDSRDMDFNTFDDQANKQVASFQANKPVASLQANKPVASLQANKPVAPLHEEDNKKEMTGFAREEIIMEPYNDRNSSEFVSRIDAIIGSNDKKTIQNKAVLTNETIPTNETISQDESDEEKGFLARGFKKMTSLIPGSSQAWQGPDEDDFEVETFDQENEEVFDSTDNIKDSTDNIDHSIEDINDSTDNINQSSNNIQVSSKKVYEGKDVDQVISHAQIIAQEERLAQEKNEEKSSSAGNEDTMVSDSVVDDSDFYEPVIKEIEEEEEEIFFQLPPITILDEVRKTDTTVLEAELREKGEIIISTLMEFKIKARILEIVCGPSVTQFQIQIAKGVKVSKVLSLQENIGMNLAIHSVRIEAPIPGKSAIGVEIPNSIRTPVHFREIVENMLVKKKNGFLNMGFGKDIAGRYVCADLAGMPHLLVAGATGSGKSVCMNTIICSILFESTPQDVKFIMVDPKMVEMTVYKDIPHLLVPPIIDAKEAAAALNWCVEEMERRYTLLSLFGVRNIQSYNEYVESGEIKVRASKLEPEDYAKIGPLTKIPFIVVIIDELADLMLVASKDVETSISRIAAKARAIGIHLVIATQRPSVNVITGVIKANLPSRIAFAVSSVVDSKTILDRKGADLLLGKGDMLFSPVGQRKPTRLQGAFISDDEVERLCDFLREQSVPDYNPEITKIADESSEDSEDLSDLDNYLGRDKELVIKAARHVVETNFASASGLQRHLRIGYARAGRVVDILEKLGVISSKNSKNNRKIHMTSAEVEDLFL